MDEMKEVLQSLGYHTPQPDWIMNMVSAVYDAGFAAGSERQRLRDDDPMTLHGE